MEGEEEDDNDLFAELNEVKHYSEIDKAIRGCKCHEYRLRRLIEFWKRIEASEYILSVIRDGYISFAICPVSSPKRYKK